jgi:hypothetical protein
MKAARSFETSGTTKQPLANPVAEVRCSGRVQTVLFLPLSTAPKKLSFNRPALSRMMMIIIIIIIIINENINLITHNNYLKKEKSYLKFLHDMFGHLKWNSTLFLPDVTTVFWDVALCGWVVCSRSFKET